LECLLDWVDDLDLDLDLDKDVNYCEPLDDDWGEPASSVLGRNDDVDVLDESLLFEL
jgi:hypothetical protein